MERQHLEPPVDLFSQIVRSGLPVLGRQVGGDRHRCREHQHFRNVSRHGHQDGSFIFTLSAPSRAAPLPPPGGPGGPSTRCKPYAASTPTPTTRANAADACRVAMSPEAARPTTPNMLQM